MPFQQPPAPCTEWVDRFFNEYLVLHEDRNAEFSDLQRFFMFMDDDGKLLCEITKVTNLFYEKVKENRKHKYFIPACLCLMLIVSKLDIDLSSRF